MLRVRIRRDQLASKSLALVEVLTPCWTWTELAAEPPPRWHVDTPPVRCADQETLIGIVEALLERAAAILAPRVASQPFCRRATPHTTTHPDPLARGLPGRRRAAVGTTSHRNLSPEEISMFIDATPTGHTFFELNEQARARALQAVTRAHHATWDPGEPDQLATALAAALAAALGHPGRNCHELEVTVWDDDRAHRWSLAGMLHPATAPALPWTQGIHAVSVAWHRRIHIHADGQPAAVEVQRMRTAMQASIVSAWQTAHQQVAAWQALEWVAAYGPRFTAAGALANRPGRAEP